MDVRLRAIYYLLLDKIFLVDPREHDMPVIFLRHDTKAASIIAQTYVMEQGGSQKEVAAEIASWLRIK